MKKILAALSLAIATAIGVVVTPTIVTWAAIVIGLGLAGKVTGWGCTEAYKRMCILPPLSMTIDSEPITQRQYWSTEEGKRRIYATAVVFGTLWTFLCGAVFWLLLDGSMSTKQRLALALLWFIWSLLIGVTSPRTYTFTIKYLFPLLYQKLQTPAAPCPAEPEEGDKTIMVDRRSQ